MADSTTIKIGGLATLSGPFESLGLDGVRGVQLAVNEFDGQIPGKTIEVLWEETNITPDLAFEKARSLIEEQHVDFIVGPVSGNEGLAVKQYAKSQPNYTFVNGSSGSQDVTLRDPAPNFFNFAIDGAQCLAGLGPYIYHTLGYKRIVTIAENYSYPHAQLGGFMTEYCRVGGRVVNKLWVGVGQSDFLSIIPMIPNDIDAIFVALGGSDVVHFLQQYESTGSQKPIVGGAITADQTIISDDSVLGDYLLGVISCSPTADDNPSPAWQQFVSAYRAAFPDGLNFPSYFALDYYLNMKAALLALQEVKGDLSNGQQRFKAALSQVQFEGPSGPVRLDHNRQAISNAFITEVAQQNDGTLYKKLIKITENVNQTLGIPEQEYLALGRWSADNPSCR